MSYPNFKYVSAHSRVVDLHFCIFLRPLTASNFLYGSSNIYCLCNLYLRISCFWWCYLCIISFWCTSVRSCCFFPLLGWNMIVEFTSPYVWSVYVFLVLNLKLGFRALSVLTIHFPLLVSSLNSLNICFRSNLMLDWPCNMLLCYLLYICNVLYVSQ